VFFTLEKFLVYCEKRHNRYISGAGGGTRTPTGKSPTDFHTIYGFHRPALASKGFGVVCGLDYPFAVPRQSFRGLGAARLVSTPSRQKLSFRAWLGIAISQGSPNLSSSTSRISTGALKAWLKSVASTGSATPAQLSCITAAGQGRKNLTFGRLMALGAVGFRSFVLRGLLGRLRAFAPHIDSGDIDRYPEMDGVVLFDHLDGCAAVLCDLINIGALHQAEADIGMA